MSMDDNVQLKPREVLKGCKFCGCIVEGKKVKEPRTDTRMVRLQTTVFVNATLVGQNSFGNDAALPSLNRSRY